MRASIVLRIKPRSTSNTNQAAMARQRDLEAIRARHAEKVLQKEETPFGKADRHVIAAWMEIEQEDRQEQGRKGLASHLIEQNMVKARFDWIAATTKAWEKANPVAAAAAVAAVASAERDLT